MAEHRKLRGVNLGGWLVLERWITPSLFEDSTAKDEYSFMQESGAREKIEQHRRTFISEEDFKWLSSSGVTAVRIPVGYWVLDGDGPFTACVSYLDWAVAMAEKYHIAVLIDLHGAKGSQNGKDHSGKIGAADWFKSASYRQETVVVLKRLARRYESSSAVWGIELLNEPQLSIRNYFILLWFYRAAYREVSKVARPGTRIVFSDGFAPRLLTGALWSNKTHPPVMDVHWYQSGRTNIAGYLNRLTKKHVEISRLQKRQPIIVGEWSGMVSHLTLADMNNKERTAAESLHIERQIAAYDSAAGWFYWTYKTEPGGVWSFRDQVETGSLLFRD